MTGALSGPRTGLDPTAVRRSGTEVVRRVAAVLGASLPVSPAFVRLARVLLAFFAGGWLTAMVVFVPDSAWTLETAAFSLTAMRSACLAAFVGLLVSPILVFRRTPWWIGLFLGATLGALAVWTYFFLWPHDWQASRWGATRAAGFFLSVYWKRLFPCAMAFGVAATWWSQRPVAPTRWEQVLEEESRTEVLILPLDPEPEQKEEVDER